MSKILLDYLFPITAIEPTPAASTAFLKQVLVVGKPDTAVTPGVITLCTSLSQAEAKFAANASLEVAQLFAAGMSRVYVLPVEGLDDVAAAIEGHESDFFTILISRADFADADVTDDLDVGDFTGVVGVASTDDTFLATQAAIANRCAFHVASANNGKNMFYAFGKLLSNSLAWRNQQYVPMPFADDVDTLGDANALFDARISFVISDSEFSTRLSMFCAGGKAIVAPYISKNLQIDLQSEALSYISGNQPAYTKTQAALLEDELQKVIDEQYIATKMIDAGVVEVSLVEDNFVASGEINIAEPKALWRIFAEMRQTL